MIEKLKYCLLAPGMAVYKILMRIEQALDRGSDFLVNIIRSEHIKGKENNKVCLFSHFDQDDLIDDYVVKYLECLNQQNLDIVFISNSSLAESEIRKIDAFCLDIVLKDNVGYDFGAWKAGIDYLGNKLQDYEELVICNDSVYAPLFDLDDMFEKMGYKYDFWGIIDSYEIKHHLQSYLMVFNKKVFCSDVFREFWDDYRLFQVKMNIVRKYEVELTQKLLGANFKMGVYLPYEKLNQSRTLNSTHYLYKELIRDFHCPLIKIGLLRDNPNSVDISAWEDVIEENTDYDINLIKNHLKRVKKDRSAISLLGQRIKSIFSLFFSSHK